MGDFVRQMLGALGVWSIFWLSAVGPYAFPAAGEIAIVLAAGTRAYPPLEIIGLAIAGAVVSDHLAYWFGRLAGSRLLARVLSEQRRKTYESRIERQAPPWLIFGRLVTALRTYLALAAGAGRYRYDRFSTFNLIGCAIYAVAFWCLGYLLGAAVDLKAVVAEIERFAGLIAILVIATYVGVFLIRVVRKRRRGSS